jgi:hypothetical protein
MVRSMPTIDNGRYMMDSELCWPLVRDGIYNSLFCSACAR